MGTRVTGTSSFIVRDVTRADRVAAAQWCEARPQLSDTFINYGRNDPDQLLREGRIAEIIVARWLGVPVMDSRGPDGGIDVPWIQRVQVKWNHWPFGDFYCRPGQPFNRDRADIGILVLPYDRHHVALAGWCTPEQYEDHGAPKSYGYNIVHALPVHKLHPMWTLHDAVG